MIHRSTCSIPTAARRRSASSSALRRALCTSPDAPLSRFGSNVIAQEKVQRAGTSAMLTRDFIAKSLYNQDTGYFTTKDVINDLPGPLDFTSMLGEVHYRMDVKKAYDSKLSAWMTPVETFSPYFSQALAKFILREAKVTSSAIRARDGARGLDGSSGTAPLIVYEAGGGTGTNALNILNWLRREEPRLYARTEYTIIEISQRLAEQQRERVSSVHANCRVLNENVLEWGSSGEIDDRHCFFLGMELLDNLPHDKVTWSTPTVDHKGESLASHPTHQELCEAVVLRTGSGYEEAFRPLRDATICELLGLCPELVELVRDPTEAGSGDGHDGGSVEGSLFGQLAHFFRGDLRPEYRAAFVPTGALRLVQALHRRLPRHRAILADFDSFEGSAETKAWMSDDGSLSAFQAPIVSSRDPEVGTVTDHGTYMVELGAADIFFPTCFDRLSRMHSGVCSRGSGRIGRGRGLVVKQWEFLRKFAHLKATRTLSGFNPLVDDFKNASMFISGPVLL